MLAESEDQPHLVEALDGVVRRLGGCTKLWRFDRMTTVCHPATGRITATFAPVAKHYGVEVAICPSRHGNRKGVVEKGNHSLAQRWWRTLADDLTVAQAQSGLDEFCVRVGDARGRTLDRARTTVGELAVAEPLAAPPLLPYPAEVSVARIVSAQALVAFRGNFYSIGPGLSGATVTVRRRLDTNMIEVATTGGVVLARHRREPDGAGVIARQTSMWSPSSTQCWPRSATGPLPDQRTTPTLTGGAPGGGPTARRCRQPPATTSWLTSPTTPPRPRPRPHYCWPNARTPPWRWSPMSEAPRTHSEAETYQRLRAHLAFLKLADAAQALPGLLDEARTSKLPLIDTLERLLDVEVTATEDRRLTSGSGSPVCRHPGGWPTSTTPPTRHRPTADPGAGHPAVHRRGRQRDVHRTTRRRKTMLAVGLARAGAEAGHRVYFTTAAGLAARCHKAALEGRWATMMGFRRPPAPCHRRAGLPPAGRRRRRRPVPSDQHPLHQRLLDPDHHQRRHRVLGHRVRRRPDGGRRDA